MHPILKPIIVVCLLFFMQQTRAQILPNSNSSTQQVQLVAPSQEIYLSLMDSTIISSITLQGKPVFTIAGINNIVNQYTVTGFTKAFPESRYREMRNIYKMKVNDTLFAQQLKAAYNLYFPYYEVVTGGVLAYTPVDFPNLAPFRNTDYLKYINAEAAWDVTKGDTVSS